ncbi:RNA polymerase sigma-E factor [Streptomyces acidiscabies]|nr:RNA polymerase sigma-E factor [Streptomyces acidiscabies]GAV40602.1 RNA polymerase sigma-E factor [Streptomyces acidiscabies]
MRDELEEQFQEFVRARWTRLVRTAYLLTGDPHHAEDLTQTALAKAYRSWRRVSRADSPEAYVRRMLVTCNNDRFRKRRVRESLTAAPPDTVAYADHPVEDRGPLLTALAELPDRQRAVVVLRYWEDLSESEVAEVLGCSQGTVKSQASKGLAKLRSHPGLARTPGGGPHGGGPSLRASGPGAAASGGGSHGGGPTRPASGQTTPEADASACAGSQERPAISPATRTHPTSAPLGPRPLSPTPTLQKGTGDER